MKKPKIYLDTSVISYLDQQDSPEKMEETQWFWEILKEGKYDILLSDITLYELTQCSFEKQEVIFAHLQQVAVEEVHENEESIELSEIYIRRAVLSAKSRNDCRHIALASILESDYIASWNFKHMSNISVMNKVQIINGRMEYKRIFIYPPTEFLVEEN